MIKVFFDTEFTGLHQNTTLISIGLVSEDGRTFYAEFNDYDETQVDDWLRDNVITKLRFSEPPEGEMEHWSWSKQSVEMRGDSKTIARYLEDWFQELLSGPVSWVDYNGNEPERIEEPSIELWSDCLSYDFVLFNQLWGHAFNIPKCVYYIPFDICTMFKTQGIDPDINREQFANNIDLENDEVEKHNALWDAKVIKQCYINLVNDPYVEIRKKFKDGDWVYGVGEHKGCSECFDMTTRIPQPFSYLSDNNPDDFRLATPQEIVEWERL